MHIELKNVYFFVSKNNHKVQKSYSIQTENAKLRCLAANFSNCMTQNQVFSRAYIVNGFKKFNELLK